MARDDRAGDSGDINTFIGLDKSKIIQDVRIFSETPLNVRRCNALLTKALYLIYRGNGENDSTVLDRTEATKLFFAATKTFQCKDSRLKKLTFLVVKELAGMADDVIIVISSLTQDITTRSEPIIRANAIRSLGAVTDGSLVGGIERFIKQCMLDREQLVSSAALVTAIHFYEINQEAVRRWVPEIQQCLSQAKDISQFHAVVLMLLLKQGDRMSCIKLIREILSMPTHPLTACVLLQTYDHLCRIGFVQHGTMLVDLTPFLKYKDKNDMVALEAARIICNHNKTLHAKDLQYAIGTLGSFLSSAQVPSVFAALRTLSRLAMTVPEVVTPLNPQLEKMVTHANRNIATVAVTTLLKTGNDSSIDNLLSKIGDYVSDISDEFRVTIVEAVHRLCLRFPAKHQNMLDFLGKTLREEGGFEYKACTVNAICDLLAAIPKCRDAALQHLCEFIEDSEHTKLTIQVIYVLAEEASRTTNASLIVRCISNRLILEETIVRIAAIDALVKIAATVPSLRNGLMTFLEGFSGDHEDSVAEHAAIGLRALKRDSPAQFLYPETVYDLDALESRLAAFINGTEKNLCFDGLPLVPVASLNEQVVPESEEIGVEDASAVAVPEEHTSTIPEADSYGPRFTSSEMLAMTDPEAEYAVHVVKHIFPHHLVLEFICRNTVPGQLLANVQVDLRTSVPLKIVRSHPIRTLRFEASDSVFIAFESEASMKPSLQFQCALRFLAHQCGERGDILDAGYPEQYPIGSFDIDLVDYIRPEPQPGPNLTAVLRDTFTLTAIDTVQAAAKELRSLIGGFPIKNAIEPDGRHSLLLSGTIYPSGPFLTTCHLSKNLSTAGVTLDLQIAAADKETAASIMDLIA